MNWWCVVECGVGGNERKSLSVYRREDVNLCVGLRVVRMSRVISIPKKKKPIKPVLQRGIWSPGEDFIMSEEWRKRIRKKLVELVDAKIVGLSIL